MKICIFNDRKTVMHLQIQSITHDRTTNERVDVPCGDHEIVEFTVPSGSVPYFKVWETGQALLSSIDLNLLERT